MVAVNRELNDVLLRHRLERLRSFRRLAAAAVFAALSAEFAERLWLKQRGPLVEIELVVSRWSWLSLGLWHAVRWVQCRRIAKHALKQVRVQMVLKVAIRTRSLNPQKRNGSTPVSGG